MLSPPNLPPSRSSSQCQRVQKSLNSSRRDKFRQGKLIRCWTDEEESYLFRSRNQKLPYKHIAHYLDKSELACRLHYHHMVVGRKGHHVDDSEDESSEAGSGSSPTNRPPENGRGTGRSCQGPLPLEPAQPVPGTQPCTLPSFDTFLRDTFHRRSVSMPESVNSDENMAWNVPSQTETYPKGNMRAYRRLSGTWLQGMVDVPSPTCQEDATKAQSLGDCHGGNARSMGEVAIPGEPRDVQLQPHVSTSVPSVPYIST
ncbi:hypothetical protein ABEF95_015607 [Exophiala dermatitidis]